ncbi:MAG: aspartate/glutamate racemase family protein [Methyloligellaceae bacterium]
MKVSGGKTVYGASLGILMLEAQFPRIPGDMGNAETWPFPVQYRVVPNASPDRVVRHQAEGLLPAFIETAEDLVAHGVDGITTNCGFLSLFQEQLTKAVPVPVAASSLMQVSLVNSLLPPGQRTGLLTISGSTLTEQHLVAANVPLETPIETTEDGQEFSRAILDDEPQMDVSLARQDNVEAALRLKSKHRDLGAIVLECTNMTPYAADIQEATQMPTYSMVSFVSWFHSGLVPRTY